MMLRRLRALALPALVLLLVLSGGCRTEKKKQGVDIEIDSVADTVRTPPRGEMFISREGGFSVRLPFGFGPPLRERARIEGATGRSGLTVYTSESGEHAVMIAFATLPGDDAAEAEPKLDAARDAAIRSIGGAVVQEARVERQGDPGRSITLTTLTPAGGAALGRLDFYLIDGRLYELFYLSPTKQDFASPDVAEFFESFQTRGEKRELRIEN